MEKEYIATYLVKQQVKVTAESIESVETQCNEMLHKNYGKDNFILHSIKKVEEKEVA